MKQTIKELITTATDYVKKVAYVLSPVDSELEKEIDAIVNKSYRYKPLRRIVTREEK